MSLFEQLCPDLEEDLVRLILKRNDFSFEELGALRCVSKAWKVAVEGGRLGELGCFWESSRFRLICLLQDGCASRAKLALGVTGRLGSTLLSHICPLRSDNQTCEQLHLLNMSGAYAGLPDQRAQAALLNDAVYFVGRHPDSNLTFHLEKFDLRKGERSKGSGLQCVQSPIIAWRLFGLPELCRTGGLLSIAATTREYYYAFNQHTDTVAFLYKASEDTWLALPRVSRKYDFRFNLLTAAPPLFAVYVRETIVLTDGVHLLRYNLLKQSKTWARTFRHRYPRDSAWLIQPPEEGFRLKSVTSRNGEKLVALFQRFSQEGGLEYIIAKEDQEGEPPIHIRKNTFQEDVGAPEHVDSYDLAINAKLLSVQSYVVMVEDMRRSWSAGIYNPWRRTKLLKLHDNSGAEEGEWETSSSVSSPYYGWQDVLPIGVVS